MNTPHPNSSSARRTALIIEDDQDFNGLLAFQLQRAGYHIVQCYTGQSALDAARQLHPTLITLDIVLPDVDGWRVLRDLKSMPHLQRVPVLVISILGEGELGSDCGPTAYLRKPASRSELIDAIHRLALPANKPTRVLLVDDDRLITDMIGAMLRPPAFSFRAAASAQAALRALNNELPDLILLDLVMPEVSGYQLLEMLRADPRTRHLPVLALTAKHLTPKEQIALSQAAEIKITKSAFNPQRLIEKIHHLERVHPLIDPFDMPAQAQAQVEMDMSQFREDFMREAHTQLSNLRASLERYGQGGNAAALEAAMQAAHTLKGDAAAMGFLDLSDLAAQAEDLFARALPPLQTPLDSNGLRRARVLWQNMTDLVARL